MTKPYDPESLRLGKKAGFMEGVSKEARESLLRRFTEAELRQIVMMVWFDDTLQSLRTRIGELERMKKAFAGTNWIIKHKSNKISKLKSRINDLENRVIPKKELQAMEIGYEKSLEDIEKFFSKLPDVKIRSKVFADEWRNFIDTYRSRLVETE